MLNPTAKIIVNGKEVGLEKVPEMLRRFVVDADQNGIPDFMDNLIKNPLFKMVAGKSMENLKSQLQNMKNLTPEQQAKISTLLEKLGEAGGNVTASSASVSTTASTSSGFRPKSSTPAIDYRKLGIPDPEQKRAFLGPMVVALLVGLVGLVAMALWVLMKSRG